MYWRRLLLIFIILILSAGGISCQSQDSANSLPTEQDDETYFMQLSREAAMGGNLHYFNFVLTDLGAVYFTDIDGNLTVKTNNNRRTRILIDHAASNLAINADTLFYTQGTAGGYLHKIDQDGTNQVRIGRNSLKYLIFTDDLIFAIETGSGKVISLQPDGTGRTDITENVATALFYQHGKIYISSASATDGVIELDLTTGEKRQVIDRLVSSLNVDDNWLYFADPLEQNRLFARSMQENETRRISDFGLEKPFIISDGYLYGILAVRQNQLYRWPLNGHDSLDLGEAELIIDDAVDKFVVSGDRIYYQRPDSKRNYVQIFEKESPERFS